MDTPSSDLQLALERSNERNTEEFLNKYKQLEEAAKQAFDLSENDSVMRYLENAAPFARYASELDYCREVRNLLQHRPKMGDRYAVAPSVQMIELLDKLIACLEERASVMQVAVPWSGIYWRALSDSVSSALSVMRDKMYTAVPVVDDKKVVGVFDGVALAGYLADCGDSSGLENGLTFADIQEYLALDSHDTEVYLFVPRAMYADELEDLFEEQFKRGKRVEIAFVTEHGKPDESILGMITAWDLLVKVD